MRKHLAKKGLTTAVVFALFSSPAFAGSTSFSLAAVANDLGISQSIIQAAKNWFQSDANSDTNQNREVLKTGNALGGQSETTNRLANNQSNAAIDPAFTSVEADRQSAYENDWDNYRYNESAYSAASADYNSCVSGGGKDCINNSGQYAEAAGYYYSRYQYEYGLWRDDVQQAQAMNETAAQQGTLSGAFAQSSAASYQAYQNALNAINGQSSAMTQNTQEANAGNNSSARSSGDATAFSQIGSMDAAANAQIRKMESETGQMFQTTPTSMTDMSASPGPVADAYSNANYQSDAEGMADASGAIAAINRKYGQQPAVLPTKAAATSPAGNGEIQDSQLQTAMDNLSNAATQNADNALIQQGYANNRASDANSAKALSSADGAAASVAPTPESGVMWGDGSALDAGTANQYQQDAAATAATASADMQTYQADQTQADTDALQMNNNLTAQANTQAAADLRNNGIIQTVPSINSASMQNAMDQQQAAMNAAQIQAEIHAAKALSAQQEASDAESVAATDSQLQQADTANAQGSTTADLKTTWHALAGSYQSSAAQAQAAAKEDTNTANQDTAEANAEEAQAEGADSGYGVNADAVAAGNAAASAAISTINAQFAKFAANNPAN